MPERVTPSTELAAWLARPLAEAKLRGLGPKSRQKLAGSDIRRVAQLLFTLPRDYRDYSQATSINQAPLNTHVRLEGRILSKKQGRSYQRRIPYLEALLDDGQGTLRIVWYHQAYLDRKLRKGDHVAVCGKIRFEKLGRAMTNPTLLLDPESEYAQGIVPVYREVGGLKSERIGTWVQGLLDQMPSQDSLPQRLLSDLKLPRLSDALREIHRPPDREAMEQIQRRKAPCLARLVFEELFFFQWGLHQLTATEVTDAPVIAVDPEIGQRLRDALPFQLTRGQRHANQAIRDTWQRSQRVFMLIQGDVGCGKTVVALMAAYHLAAAGWQSALGSPGSRSMTHFGKLFASRPWSLLVPDYAETIVSGNRGSIGGSDYVMAARASDGSVIMAYLPKGQTVTVDMSRVAGGAADAWWYDPENGNPQYLGEFPTSGSQDFTPPDNSDRVLVIDNADTGFPPPGVSDTVLLPAAQCSDGIDNDSDNLTDLADPGCSLTVFLKSPEHRATCLK